MPAHAYGTCAASPIVTAPPPPPAPTLRSPPPYRTRAPLESSHRKYCGNEERAWYLPAGGRHRHRPFAEPDDNRPDSFGDRAVDRISAWPPQAASTAHSRSDIPDLWPFENGPTQVGRSGGVLHTPQADSLIFALSPCPPVENPPRRGAEDVYDGRHLVQAPLGRCGGEQVHAPGRARPPVRRFDVVTP